MVIKPSSEVDLPLFVDLLEELGGWLWSRGIQQWSAGSNHEQIPVLLRQLSEGVLLLAREGSRLAGGCIVTHIATEEWAERHAPGAAYLHKLAVARFAAGRALGRELLNCAERWCEREGLSELRLDCWDGNTVLRAYYRGAGFTELEAVPSQGYRVRLFSRSFRGP